MSNTNRVKLAAIAALGCTLTACANLQSISIHESHTSHPFAGPPFGPPTEEEAIDTINVSARWEFKDRVFLELSPGYKIADGGLYGPKLTTTINAGVYLWKR